MNGRSELYGFLYGGTVLEKRQRAGGLHHRFGSELLALPEINDWLRKMEEAQWGLKGQMEIMAMGHTCSWCARRPGGGCCSHSMAGENDVLQLLMNLLAGVELQIQQQRVDECVFLGETGCVLRFKPMFCLNYNCSHIRKRADRQALLLLEKKTGTLLTRQAELETRLVDFFCATLASGVVPATGLGSEQAIRSGAPRAGLGGLAELSPMTA